MDALMIISSDGHATARMPDYRPYLEERYLEEFDEFLGEWEQHGSRNFDPPALKSRMDQPAVDDWTRRMVDTGRLDGNWDPVRRLQEMEAEGVAAEVLFPDFGLPFELYGGTFSFVNGRPARAAEHIQVGNRAFNRWLADFVSATPERFAGMAAVSWEDVDAAVGEIVAAREAGLRGVTLPAFSPDRPLYHEDFEPIWSVLEDLDMVANSHVIMSSTSNVPIYAAGVPHFACAARVIAPEVRFFSRNILSHLIWGGVLERHPWLRCAFTEQGSSWVISMLNDMDYTYTGSYYRTDFKSVIRSKPSEYFTRQCYLGSSTFSRAEVAARDEIGVGQMMMGMDFPHHEGAFAESTVLDYLQATFGAAQVPETDARRMLGETAAAVFGFDLEHLRGVAARVGLQAFEVLRAPERNLFPLGDVNKPL